MGLPLEPRVGPYRGVLKDKQVSYDDNGRKRTFRFLLYCAYDAFGLIGSECNGIAALNEDEKTVLCDEIARCSSGYQMPTDKQLAIFDSFDLMSFEDFRKFINGHSRARYTI